MARAAKASKSTRATTPARKIGPASKGVAGKSARASASAPEKRTARTTAAVPAPKVSKDELRANVEKLEQLVATLRAKSREANKMAKAATARISELEAEVARLEKKAAAASPSAREQKPARVTRGRNKSREIDPGDAVPPGVAVEEPAPLDEEAETALDNLDRHLDHE